MDLLHRDLTIFLFLFWGLYVNDTIAGKFIRGVQLFHGMTHDEIQLLLDAAEDLHLPKDAIVFAEGDESQDLFFVIEGRVRISLAMPIQGDAEVAVIEPQGVFGESSFFHPAKHHATAQCLTPVRLVRLRRSQYDQLLTLQNIAAYKLAVNAASVLGERLQQTDEWIERMLQGRQNAETLSAWKQFRGGLRLQTR